MSKILPRGVTGFTSVTVSLASFWAYSWKLPDGANGAESLQELGHMCVFLVPSDKPNPTKQNNLLSYPLSMPVPAVDRKSRVISVGFRVSPERCSGASEPHQKLGGSISHV